MLLGKHGYCDAKLSLLGQALSHTLVLRIAGWRFKQQ